jgi:hypothetical protein
MDVCPWTRAGAHGPIVGASSGAPRDGLGDESGREDRCLWPGNRTRYALSCGRKGARIPRSCCQLPHGENRGLVGHIPKPEVDQPQPKVTANTVSEGYVIGKRRNSHSRVREPALDPATRGLNSHTGSNAVLPGDGRLITLARLTLPTSLLGESRLLTEKRGCNTH